MFEEVNKGADFPDLRQVLVLSKPDWLRIQDEMNQVDKEKKRMIEEAKQREALHLQSVEVVKQWSDTFAVSCPFRIFFSNKYISVNEEVLLR